MTTLTTPASGAPEASFAPQTPRIHVAPTKVADETFVIHQVQEALGEPLFVYLNSMVIRSAEPVIVDTGTLASASVRRPADRLTPSAARIASWTSRAMAAAPDGRR